MNTAEKEEWEKKHAKRTFRQPSGLKIMYADADAATINEKAAEYASLQESVQSAAARGYVDTIISAEDTRKYVIGAFEMLFTKREDRPAKKHGTV